MAEKHLYLLDGHALAYRAFYAMIRTPLSSSEGIPTGAVYGFTNTILHLLDEYNCSYLAAVFDSPTPSFRQELFEQYKANRSEMPDDMKTQMPMIFDMVERFNIPVLRREGLEADDLLAYATLRAVQEGYKVTLVTRDKDLMQLVGNGVDMLSPETGGGFTRITPEMVEKKMGVPPHKIMDFLALTGDTSDNIPGVPGVGPKTAVKILAEVESVRDLLSDPSKLTNEKLRKKIVENRAALELSSKLVKLKTDIDFPLELESLAAREPNRTVCLEKFQELNFSTFRKHRLFENRTETEFKVALVTTLEELDEIVYCIRERGFVSIDTETTSTEPRCADLVGISLAVEPDRAWYVPVAHDDTAKNLDRDSVLQRFRSFLESSEVEKIGQNLKYDYQVFKGCGIAFRGIRFDAMVAAYLIEPGKRQYGMGALAEKWLNTRTVPIENLIGTGKNQKLFSQVPVPEAARYAGEDAVIPLRLKEVLKPILEERKLTELFEAVEMPLVPILGEMEYHGVSVDCDLLERMSVEYTGRLEGISAEIYELAGEEFNLNSPKQVAEILFTKLALPKSKRTKTGLSTNVDALEKLVDIHPIAGRLLSYREVQKLLSTYIDALPVQILTESGRIHSSFNQTIAATGRLSCTNPNLQNIPIRTEDGRRIREAFTAASGNVMVSADYSQIELRILAHLSQDKLLLDAFRNDMDIHTQTASAIYSVHPEMVMPEMRRAAKTINFGLMYGMGPVNLSRQLKISFKEARQFIETYFEQFPTVKTFMDESIEKAREHGYSETLLGRRRYLPEISAKSRQIREAAERIAINTPVQGTAADIIKLAMIRIERELSQKYPQAAMVLQVHDELVFEVPHDRAADFRDWVVERMSAAYELDIPLKVDAGVGDNWAAAH